ncbi:MAG: hypothetical protein VKS61_09780 [Candidatus Sericytochromatia bacterium]|nr:hypothetical protein [Candidatus Sericytochromatia bacterium]
MPLVAAQRLMLPLARREARPTTSPMASLSADEAIARAEALAAQAMRDASPTQTPPTAGWLGLRDADEVAWSVLGALECGQLGFAGKLLERVMTSQQPDGRLPATPRAVGGRLGRWLSRLGRGRAAGRAAEDLRRCGEATAMLAWACAEFALRTGDFEFCRRWRKALEAAVAWLDAQGQPATGLGQAAAYHQAQMALGHLAIASGDAVEGARRWAAAAAAKGQLLRTLATAEASAAERLLALGVSRGEGQHAREALTRCDEAGGEGLRAWVATELGEATLAREALEAAGRQAVEAGGFRSRVEAGQFLRGLQAWRRLAASLPPPRIELTPRRWALSEDEVRILAAC